MKIDQNAIQNSHVEEKIKSMGHHLDRNCPYVERILLTWTIRGSWAHHEGAEKFVSFRSEIIRKIQYENLLLKSRNHCDKELYGQMIILFGQIKIWNSVLS